MMSFKIVGIPRPTIHILKNDLDFPTNDRVIIHCEEKELVLTVKDANRSDTGKYKIIIKNDLGEADASVDVMVYGMFPLFLQMKVPVVLYIVCLHWKLQTFLYQVICCPILFVLGLIFFLFSTPNNIGAFI